MNIERQRRRPNSAFWAGPAFLPALAILLGIGCGGPTATGLVKHPVRGSVRVNGEPASGLIVTFNNRAPEVSGNAARPVGVVDQSGRFELSTDASRDGAVAGDYVATFYWPSDNTPSAVDRLGGRFVDITGSSFSARVGPGENVLVPFELQAEIRSPRPTSGSARTPPRDF